MPPGEGADAPAGAPGATVGRSVTATEKLTARASPPPRQKEKEKNEKMKMMIALVVALALLGGARAQVLEVECPPKSGDM